MAKFSFFDISCICVKDYKDEKPSLNPPFSSVYLCSGILDSKIVFEYIEK